MVWCKTDRTAMWRGGEPESCMPVLFSPHERAASFLQFAKKPAPGWERGSGWLEQIELLVVGVFDVVDSAGLVERGLAGEQRLLGDVIDDTPPAPDAKPGSGEGG